MLDQFKNEAVIDTDDTAGSVTSDAFDLRGLDRMLSVQKVTGLTGTLAVEVSNDGETWKASGLTMGAGNDLQFQAPIGRYYRAVWTYTSGTGPIKVIIHGS